MNNQIEIHFLNATTKVSFESDFAFNNYFQTGNSIVVTDSNIMNYYSDLINDFKCIVVDDGESCKSMDTVSKVIDQLIELKADRSTNLIAFGGGAICDLTAFVASLYMRGMRHTFVPTSLLGMVDASIGGKTAINYNNIKNLVGTFKHPELVVINPKFLSTLPKIEYYSGLAELIKIALITDKSLCNDLLKIDIDDYLNIDNTIIYNALLRKAGIVIKDEKDIGIRNILNFGHTLGHIVETEYKVPHGIAVAIGMKLSLKMSFYLKLIDIEDFNKSISLIEKIIFEDFNIDYDLIISKLVNDKKRIGDRIKFILLNGLGSAIVNNIEIAELEQLCKAVLNPNFA